MANSCYTLRSTITKQFWNGGNPEEAESWSPVSRVRMFRRTDAERIRTHLLRAFEISIEAEPIS